MARTKDTLAKMLALYLVLLPLFGMRAEAQQAPQSIPELVRPLSPDRGDPHGPAGPPLPPVAEKIVFTPAANPLTIRAFNGFSSEATPGFFKHDRHNHGGGTVRVDSPWGEQLKIRYSVTAHGMAFEYDDDLVVRYNFDEAGTLSEIVAESSDRVARMAVGKRAELAYLGQRDFSSFDMSAYQLIEESLRAKHSDAFLAGVRQFEGAAEASCATDAIQCAACVVVWALSVAAISTACVVGGVVTFGAACIAAIIAHEATGFSCAATCIEMIDNCRRSGQTTLQSCYP